MCDQLNNTPIDMKICVRRTWGCRILRGSDGPKRQAQWSEPQESACYPNGVMTDNVCVYVCVERTLHLSTHYSS